MNAFKVCIGCSAVAALALWANKWSPDVWFAVFLVGAMLACDKHIVDTRHRRLAAREHEQFSKLMFDTDGGRNGRAY